MDCPQQPPLYTDPDTTWTAESAGSEAAVMGIVIALDRHRGFRPARRVHGPLRRMHTAVRHRASRAGRDCCRGHAPGGMPGPGLAHAAGEHVAGLPSPRARPRIVPPPAARSGRLPPRVRRVLAVALAGTAVAAAVLAGAVPARGGDAGRSAGQTNWRGTSSSAPRPGYGWPLPGTPRVTRRFDPPPRRWLSGHRGVDLAGRPGEPVLAAGPGRVVFAGPVAGTGVVSIAHRGGLRTTYQPVKASVHAGQRVEEGDTIGVLQGGHSGCPKAACLHWGLRRDRQYLDPLTLLGLGRVRLLPVTR